MSGQYSGGCRKLEGGKQEDGEGEIDDGTKRWRNRLKDGKVA